MYEHVPGVMWSCWHREVSITNKNSHTAIFALLRSVSSHIWSPGCEGGTLTTTMVIWVTVKYARLDPPKPGQHLELFIFTENWPEDFTYLISEAICLKGLSPVSPQLVGIWKEEYLPLCDLISKIRETYQYVNIGENRERGTGEQNSEDKMDILILYNILKVQSLIAKILMWFPLSSKLSYFHISFKRRFIPSPLTFLLLDYDFRLLVFTLPGSVPKKLFVFNLT